MIPFGSKYTAEAALERIERTQGLMGEVVSSNAKFQKRHYDVLASAIHDFTWGTPNKLLTEELANIFEKDNPNFDRKKWREACLHENKSLETEV